MDAVGQAAARVLLHTERAAENCDEDDVSLSFIIRRRLRRRDRLHDKTYHAVRGLTLQGVLDGATIYNLEDNSIMGSTPAERP